MLIVISSPSMIEEEATHINALFEAGMTLFHLRKPDAAKEEIRELLKKIEPRYHHQIALHQYHELAEEFKIERLHFTKEKRDQTNEEVLIKLKEGNYILSTSIHTIEEYKNISPKFEYIFFGPVFNSISKQGYKAAVTADFVFPVEYDRPKVIALGGIENNNIQQVVKMNFKGIAVLGMIWRKPEKCVEQFKAMQKAWNQIDR